MKKQIPYCSHCAYFQFGTMGGPYCNYVIGAKIHPVYGMTAVVEAPDFARTTKGHCGKHGRHFKFKWWRRLWQYMMGRA